METTAIAFAVTMTEAIAIVLLAISAVKAIAIGIAGITHMVTDITASPRRIMTTITSPMTMAGMTMTEWLACQNCIAFVGRLRKNRRSGEVWLKI
jgi:hypothetical protein